MQTLLTSYTVVDHIFYRTRVVSNCSEGRELKQLAVISKVQDSIAVLSRTSFYLTQFKYFTSRTLFTMGISAEHESEGNHLTALASYRDSGACSVYGHLYRYDHGVRGPEVGSASPTATFL